MRLVSQLSFIIFGLNSALAINWSNFHVSSRVTNIPARCTMHTIRQLFRPDTIVASILAPAGSQFDKSISDQLREQILKTGRWTSFTLKPLSILFSLRYDGMKPDYVIMYISSKMDINLSVQAYMNSKLWMPDVSFFILAEHMKNVSLIMSEGWLNIFWDYAVNRIYLQTINKQSGISNFWSLTQQYNPMDCSQPFWKYKIIGECNRTSQILNSTYSDETVPFNLNRCPLKIGVTHHPPFVFRQAKRWVGIEIELINFIAQYLNFTPQYKLENISEQWGEIDFNNIRNSTGLWGFLMRFEVDMIMGGIIPDFNRLAITEEPLKYGQDKVIWIVPVRIRRKSIYSIMNRIQTGAWAMFGGSVGMIMVASLLMMSTSRSIRLKGDLLLRQWYLLFDLYQLFFNYSVTRLPKTNFMRFLIAQWLILTIIWNTYVNSSLTSKLTLLDETKRVRTVDELFKSNYKIGVVTTLANWSYSELGLQFESCNSSVECYTRVANTENFALVGRKIPFGFEKDYYVDTNGRRLIGFVRGSEISVPLEILFRKRHPLHTSFKEWISRTTHHGHLYKISRKYVFKNSTLHLKNKLLNRMNQDGFTIHHMESMMPLMMMCIVICCTVFLVEILMHKLKNIFIIG